MLTQEDIKELKPKCRAVQSNLNIALNLSGPGMPEDACAHFTKSLFLIEDIVQEADTRMWQNLVNYMDRSSSYMRPALGSSILSDIISVIDDGGAQIADTFQELRADFVTLNRHLNFVFLATDLNLEYRLLHRALLLMKDLANKIEQKIWNDLLEGIIALLPSSEEPQTEDKGKKMATLLGALGGGTAASITGVSGLGASGLSIGGLGMAAGGTAAGIAGLAGAAAATGGAALAGAAALGGLYKIGKWASDKRRNRQNTTAGNTTAGDD